MIRSRIASNPVVIHWEGGVFHRKVGNLETLELQDSDVEGTQSIKGAQMAGMIQTYNEFWPHYLKEHSKPETRRLHYLGSFLVIATVAIALYTSRPVLAFSLPFAGYGPAWVAHFCVEKNRPATFKYPWWSLFSDYRMFALWLTGQLNTHLKKAGVPP